MRSHHFHSPPGRCTSTQRGAADPAVCRVGAGARGAGLYLSEVLPIPESSCLILRPTSAGVSSTSASSGLHKPQLMSRPLADRASSSDSPAGRDAAGQVGTGSTGGWEGSQGFSDGQGGGCRGTGGTGWHCLPQDIGITSICRSGMTETGQGHDRTPTSHAAPQAGKRPPTCPVPWLLLAPHPGHAPWAAVPEPRPPAAGGGLGRPRRPGSQRCHAGSPQRDTCSSAGRAACCSPAGCPGASPCSLCPTPGAQGKDISSHPGRVLPPSAPEGPAPCRPPWLQQGRGTQARSVQARAGAPGPGSNTVEPPFWRQPCPGSLGAPGELPPQAVLARVPPEPARSGQ